METRSVRFALADGTSIALPDDARVMSRYIVEEQGDWFEDELPFVRRLVGPGEVVVDVGANFGVYALSVARKVGPSGTVLAFEPAPDTAAFLRASATANGFSWLHVREAALSARPGRAALALGASPELHQLAGDSSGGAATVSVEVATLDSVQDELRGLSFVKLDAEGAEVDILGGATGLLATEDPLVMFELRHGSHVNEALLGAFRERDFSLFRLLPGLGVLVPFRDGATDRTSLNLFAARRGRATTLATRGLLVHERATAADLDPRFGATLWARAVQRQGVRGGELPASIAWFAMAHGHEDPGVRVFALENALALAAHDVEARPGLARVLTFARIAAECGQRLAAARSLKSVLAVLDANAVEIDTPFLNALARYDGLEIRGPVGRFVTAQVVEAFTKFRAYSGIFQGPEQLGLLHGFQRYGYPDAEMDRRLALATKRFATPG